MKLLVILLATVSLLVISFFAFSPATNRSFDSEKQIDSSLASTSQKSSSSDSLNYEKAQVKSIEVKQVSSSDVSEIRKLSSANIPA
ncbi:hypothetical protein OAB00_04190, partial [Akkermansiaceae bacterium]|nr:hypothetical protein [Akkermansiaceae bacterium]